MGDGSRRMPGAVAQNVRDDALGKIVGFNFIFQRQALQLGNEPPVAGNHALDQAFVRQTVGAPILAVADAGRINQCEIFRLARFQKPPLQADHQFLRRNAADKSVETYRIAVPDHTDRVVNGYNFPPLHARADIRDDRTDNPLLVHPSLSLS